MPKLRLDQYLSLSLISLALLVPVAPTTSIDIVHAQPKTRFESLPSLPAINELQQQEAENLVATLSAQAVLVIDNNSQSVLLSKQAHQLLPPASTTKIVTALVARQLYQLEDPITVREEIFANGNKMKLFLGEKLDVLTALKGLLIPSGNDVALLLANHHPDGYAGFIKEMNQLSTDLYLEDSHWTNASGLDDANHYTTAFDLAILTQELMKDEVLRQIVGTKSEMVFDTTGQYQHLLLNTHQLLGRVEGVVGVKTGTTELAREALVTQLEKDNHSILIVVLSSQDRYTETKLIIDWITAHYRWYSAESFIQSL